MSDAARHREPAATARRHHGSFIAGLGIGQIISWGSLYYSFPLIAGPMGRDLALSMPEIYGAATVGLVVGSLATYPIGVAIDRGHGRSIMACGSALGGLLLVAWSQIASLWTFYCLFIGIGLAQAMTLYEPALAIVARRYGAEARTGITALTLWGGFASTVFVPVVQLLLDHGGWREALRVLGLLNLGLCVVLHLAVIDPQADALEPSLSSMQGGGVPPVGQHTIRWALGQSAFWGLLVSLTVYSGTFSGISFHLYPLLLERGFDAATVVGVIALIGPAQVAGRLAIWVLGRNRSVRSMGMATVLALPLSLMLLMLLPSSFASLAVFAVIYGAANGVMTIVRGLAVPELLTREAYGTINGALAAPGIVARALAPAAIALLWSAAHSYDAVLIAAVMGSTLVAVSFWFVVAVTRSKGAVINNPGKVTS
ncbi:MAG: MFS transporter [Deltaproteobacteria bacterium]|nr:MFS transporter [Deltaproteobacteria bacterium]